MDIIVVAGKQQENPLCQQATHSVIKRHSTQPAAAEAEAATLHQWISGLRLRPKADAKTMMGDVGTDVDSCCRRFALKADPISRLRWAMFLLALFAHIDAEAGSAAAVAADDA